jgi:aminoglycoside/choline kinase family phosphotransferase
MNSETPIVDPGDVSASWVTQVLHRKGIDACVESIQLETVGTGQMAETRRIQIDYAGSPGPRAPRSLVGKFTSETPVAAETGHSLGVYRSEVMFYRELAARAMIRTPEVYAAEIDSQGRFVLLLEDLAPARAGDQLTGLTVEETRRALREAALLHAAFWGDESLADLDWMYVPDSAQNFYTTEMIEQAWAHVQRIYAGRLPDDVVTVCERYVAHHKAWNRPRPGPRCLTHNDFRPDNMMISDTGARTALVDWQTVSLLGVGMDVSYLLGCALPREVRNKLEVGLLHEYHDQLQVNGVSGYSYEQLTRDYRHYTFAALAVALGATLLVKQTERGDRMLIRMITDAGNHVLDTDALDVLGR